MADGETHVAYHNRLWIPALFVGGIEAIIFSGIPYYNFYLFIIFYVLFYYLGENYLSPDLDLQSLSGQDAKMIRLRNLNIVLGLFGLFWGLWSFIYAWIINGHRKTLSHGWGIGTLFRLFFYTLPFFLLMVWFGSFNGWTIGDFWYEFYCEYWLVSYLLAGFFALFFSDSIHLILDTEYAKGRLYYPKSNKKEK
jgi:uncharacterized metal-binding protein